MIEINEFFIFSANILFKKSCFPLLGFGRMWSPFRILQVPTRNRDHHYEIQLRYTTDTFDREVREKGGEMTLSQERDFGFCENVHFN